MAARQNEPVPQRPLRRVLLIQPGWPARPLVKAELEERGYELLGADSVRLAIDLCTKRGFRPELLVVDSSGLSVDEAELRALSFLRGNAPLLLIRSAQYGDATEAELAPTRVVVRPLTVGEIADAVTALLAEDA